MAGYHEGDEVAWDWGNGTAEGRIVAVYTQKRTLTIKGSDVTRDAIDACPAYRIEQQDGSVVFKSHSEVRRA